MKRSVTRQATLPSCHCDIEELEALSIELAKFFKDIVPGIRIKVSLPNEELEFSRFDELRAYEGLPSTLRSLEMALYDLTGNRGTKIGSVSSFGFSVRAIGDDPAWCVGAIEIVREFAKRHHRWYSGTWSLIVTVLSLELVIIFPFVPGFLGVLCVTAVLLFWLRLRPMVFEPFVVQLKREEAFIRRHATEIMVALTAIPALAIIVSVVVWVYKKFFQTA